MVLERKKQTQVDKDPRYICKSSPKEHKIKIKKINK